MGKKSLFLLLLVISPSLVAADKGKSAWWSTPLIIVLYIGFFVFAAGVAICVRRYRERHLHHHDNPRAPGLYPEEIDSLPSLRFSEMKLVHQLGKEDKQVECAVCLSEFKDQEILRILPDCFHVFHPDCIAPWLATHFTCPVCRLDFSIYFFCKHWLIIPLCLSIYFLIYMRISLTMTVFS